jgi:hypothetical protein
MKEIVIKTQAELDALPDRFDEYTRIVVMAEPGQRLSLNKAWENSSVVARGNSSVVARGNSSVEAWENSSVEAWENSSVVAWGNSSVVAWENSSVVARGNSSVEARGNSSVEAWENSSVEAWENSSVEARGNSSVVAWENSLVRVCGAIAKLLLHGFAVAFLPVTINLNIEKKSPHCHVQLVKDLGWFERNAVEESVSIILYKRVSSEFKTQEGTKNETHWLVGSSVEHPAWNPAENECGEGKFHGCSRPYFCDEFRNKAGDRYIALSVAKCDLYEWIKNPQYPHKIGFRVATVLYECDRYGKPVKGGQ